MKGIDMVSMGRSMVVWHCHEQHHF